MVVSNASNRKHKSTAPVVMMMMMMKALKLQYLKNKVCCLDGRTKSAKVSKASFL